MQGLRSEGDRSEPSSSHKLHFQRIGAGTPSFFSATHRHSETENNVRVCVKQNKGDHRERFEVREKRKEGGIKKRKRKE